MAKSRPYSFLVMAIDTRGWKTSFAHVLGRGKYYRPSAYATEDSAKKHLELAIEAAKEMGFKDIHWILYCNDEVIERKGE